MEIRKKDKPRFSFHPEKAKTFALLIFLSFFLGFLLSLLFSPLFTTGEAQITDTLFRLRYTWFGKETIHPFLVHIVFDDESLNHFKTSPWDRKIYGDVIRTLTQAGAGLIAFDIFFQHRGLQDSDEILIQAVKEGGNVYVPLVLFTEHYSAIPSDKGSDSLSHIINESLWFPETRGNGDPHSGRMMLAPFHELLQSASGTGHINYTPDRDGISRRFPLVFSWQSGYIPALPLQMVCDYMDVDDKDIIIDFGNRILLNNARLTGGSRKDISIPVDNRGQILLNYPAPWKNSFYEISVKDLFAAREDELSRNQLMDILEHSIVLISDVSIQNKDVGPGVFKNMHPYSEIIMTICNMILTDTYLYPIHTLLLFFIILCFSLILWFFSSYSRFTGFILFSFMTLILYIAFCIFLFLFFKRIPVLLFPCTGFFLYFLFGGVYLYYRKKRETMALEEEVYKEKAGRVSLEQEKKSMAKRLQELIPVHTPSTKKKKIHYTKAMLKNKGAFEHIITHNEMMIKMFCDIEALASSPKPVLLLGETGVGKELVATAVTLLQKRKGTYLRMNIAGMDDTLVNDTLFGHIKGAFDTAIAVRDGFLKTAEGGFLFLDEIGDLSHAVQIKLLRFIEYGEYSPLGSDEIHCADVKLIAATNKDLETEISTGRFRRDLAERLGIRIHIPPLRERIDDIPLLVDHFVHKAAHMMNKKNITYPGSLLSLLEQYPFPGNVRELESMIEEGVAKCKGDKLDPDVFKQRIEKISGESVIIDSFQTKKSFTFKNNLDELIDFITEYLIEKALSLSRQNQTKAAALLGVSRDRIKRYMQKNTNPGKE